LIKQGKSRIQELLPIRYGRMRSDPFAFLRGAAAVMAADLVHTLAAGIRMQACGDAHLANFGSYATRVCAGGREVRGQAGFFDVKERLKPRQFL
jgi:uncharacterized protein (DUF2252 family)